jgi:hypothetical protein
MSPEFVPAFRCSGVYRHTGTSGTVTDVPECEKRNGTERRNTPTNPQLCADFVQTPGARTGHRRSAVNG